MSGDALFFVPTFFSGMVSPYAVRLLVQDRNSSGRHAGQLYFVSTFGSAAGTLLTSFYLVLWLEVNQILLGLLADLGRDRRRRLVRYVLLVARSIDETDDRSLLSLLLTVLR